MCRSIGKTGCGGGVHACMHPHMEMGVKYLCLMGLLGKWASIIYKRLLVLVLCSQIYIQIQYLN